MICVQKAAEVLQVIFRGRFGVVASAATTEDCTALAHDYAQANGWRLAEQLVIDPLPDGRVRIFREFEVGAEMPSCDRPRSVDFHIRCVDGKVFSEGVIKDLAPNLLTPDEQASVEADERLRASHNATVDKEKKDRRRARYVRDAHGNYIDWDGNIVTDL